jgi:Glycogen recognition site of AMP-activated protein kinase
LTRADGVFARATFNDWTPGAHPLVSRRGGHRSVSVTLPPGEHRFRYLATGGIWFDDQAVDAVADEDGVLHL